MMSVDAYVHAHDCVFMCRAEHDMLMVTRSCPLRKATSPRIPCIWCYNCIFNSFSCSYIGLCFGAHYLCIIHFEVTKPRSM